MNSTKLLRSISAGSLAGLVLWQGCSPAPARKEPRTHTVEIRQMQFQPTSLTVQKNDTVIFINHDMVGHNVTEASNKAWGSPTLASGESWKLVVMQSGAYYCTIHPVMKGNLVVQ